MSATPRSLFLAVCMLAAPGTASAAAFDTVADRVLGQPAFSTGSVNSLDGAGLNSPAGVAVDSAGHLYIADTANNRVLAWNSVSAYANGDPADRVFGQASASASSCPVLGASSTELCGPTGVAVDSAGNLYVADTNNSRVVEYDTPLAIGGDSVADRVFGHADFGFKGCNDFSTASASRLCRPTGVAVDGSDNLYVADTENHRVVEYDAPLAAGGDTVADRVFGQASFDASGCNSGGRSAGTLCNPRSVAVDGAGNLFVADYSNQRVLEFSAPLAVSGDSADKVIGQAAFTTAVFGTGANNLFGPVGVGLDSAGNLYVTDSVNHRAFRYDAPLAVSGDSADQVFGQPALDAFGCNNGGRSASSLCNPAGLAIDGNDNLYVTDRDNNRALIYNAPRLAESDNVADKVVGQAAFDTGSINNLDGGGLSGPRDVAVDHLGHLYVADTGNNRVLVWNSASAYVSGDSADSVIGQPDLFSSDCNKGGRTASSLCAPQGVAVDGDGNLYVADTGNHRVLEYDTPLATDVTADRVFGQSAFDISLCNSGNPSFTASNLTLCSPQAVAVDGNGNLYIADTENNRVLEYNTPLAMGGDVAADNVVGQTVFSGRACNSGGISASSLCYPTGVAVDSGGNLYVADFQNNRALGYITPLAMGGDLVADQVFGQSAFDTAAACCRLMGVAVDGRGNVYVSDRDKHIVSEYDAPLAMGGDNVADTVFGQAGAGGCSNATRSASNLCYPAGLALDSAGNLYLADHDNNRVLEYDTPFGHDYGDAPAPYPSALAADGARHRYAAAPTVYLGSVKPDAEPDARIEAPYDAGDGDDLDGTPDDEDGLAVSSLIIGASNATPISVTGAGKLDIWIDHDADSAWNNTTEHVVSGLARTTGSSSINLAVPGSASPGPSYLRARYSTAGSTLPTGASTDGEVEDYPVTLRLPNLSIGSVSEAEGSAGSRTLTLTVTLETAVSQDVSVDYASTNGTATTVDGDFTAASGSLTILAGSTSGSINLTVNGDTKYESNESFTVSLSNASGAAISVGTATVTLTNDDPLPAVSSIVRAGATPTNAASVDFTVTFNKSVTGVDAGDFALTTSGLTGASITAVTGSGATRTVSVNTGAGDGSLRLDVSDNDSIVSTDGGQPLGGSGTGNGNFTTGESYTLDKSSPSVTLNQGSAQADPAGGSPVVFDVQFSEAVAGFEATDLTLSGTALPTTAVIGGGPSAYTVSVSGMSANGTVIASVNAGAVQDAAGNSSLASASTDDTVTYQAFTPNVGFTVSTQSIIEGTGAGTTTVTVTATLSQTSTQTVTAPFTVSGSSTATGGGTDYSLGASQFIFEPGNLGDSFSVSITRDALTEASETIVLNLDTPTNATLGAPATQVITIADDDVTPSENSSSGGGGVFSFATLLSLLGLLSLRSRRRFARASVMPA